MAEAANRLYEFHSTAVSQLPIVDSGGLPWVAANIIPEVQIAREHAIDKARTLLDSRMQQLRDGDFENVPYAVDPLNTAARVLQAEKRYGRESAEYQEAYYSLFTDSERLFSEAWSKTKPEHFPPIEQPNDSASDNYTFAGRSLRDMVFEGVTPVAEPEEVGYRIGEVAEEVTYSAVRKLGFLALGDVVVLRPASPIPESLQQDHHQPEASILTISECADWAIEAYESGSSNNYGGYAPEVRKLMLRGVKFGQDCDSRYQEQLGLPGIYITHEVVVEAMQLLKMVEYGKVMTKEEVRATQMLNLNGQGVFDLAELLDELASRASGKRIFMGEVIAEDQPKDYTRIPHEAATRRAQHKDNARELSDYLLSLEKSGTDHWAANSLVEHKVKKLLFDRVRSDPVQAAIIFDRATADGITEVMNLDAQGRVVEARLLEKNIEAEAPPPSFCSAGSCGLEAVAEGGVDATIARKLGLKGELLHDKERPCPKCNAMSVHYGLNGGKACTGCRYNDRGGKQTSSSDSKETTNDVWSLFTQVIQKQPRQGPRGQKERQRQATTSQRRIGSKATRLAVAA